MLLKKSARTESGKGRECVEQIKNESRRYADCIIHNGGFNNLSCSLPIYDSAFLKLE
ncbi:hypothetical protein PghCCS26_11190 [Paenibacillus glycanilyticus]|uniref:Uncharacterized protein n=1 Tax=Paenibacillus glycanilyticus TaxID=126569 RepID=A0ABQ6NG09_9BACL|nr:hypothetical protein PghCCS26_11190 [Paenibacillus glycanilyticus]